MNKLAPFLLILLLASLLTCNAEVECTQLEALSSMDQAILEWTLEQAQEWKARYETHYQIEFKDIIDEKTSERISSIPIAEPQFVVFFQWKESTYAGDMQSEHTKEEKDVPRVDELIAQSLWSNVLAHPLPGAFLDMTSIYALADGSIYPSACYALLFYADDLPVILTSFGKINDEYTLTKTGAVYSDGSYENEFVGFAGPLLIRWDADNFDIRYYVFDDPNS